MPPAAKPRFFAKPEAFGRWLQANHARRPDLVVGYWKVGTRKASMTWAQSVEQALRFGWIDGRRWSLGEEAYAIRFTPRKPGSHWSNINVRTARRLAAAGEMAPAGLAAFAARTAARTGRAHYERRAVPMPASCLRALKADPVAWADFRQRPPGYRKAVAAWLAGAKREATRGRRLNSLLASSRAGRLVPGWEWGRKSKAPSQRPL